MAIILTGEESALLESIKSIVGAGTLEYNAIMDLIKRKQELELQVEALRKET